MDHGRLRPLDGLRGVAALAVVLHHLALMMPGFLNGLWPLRDSATASVAWRGLTFPLHLLFSAGLEAVFLFFVLSGLVLTLPALRSTWYSWLDYYPRRILRLALPVLGSVALAVVLLVAVPRYPVPRREEDWLTAGNSLSFRVSDLLATLNVFGARQPMNNPLWSLGWEIVFSLLLPVGLLVAVLVRGRPRTAMLAVLGCLILTTLGGILVINALTYLPMFIAGAVLAASLPRWRERIANLTPAAGVVLCVMSLVLVSAPWLVSGISGRLYAPTIGLAVLGCIALVLLALELPWLARALTRRPVQWLGRVSFSLYLVHVPVIVTIAYLVGPERWQLFAPIGLALALLVAWLFYAAVERPSHTLARWTAQRIAARRPLAENEGDSRV